MDINNAKIIICDDSALARKQLIDVIHMVGNPTTFQAENGQEAIDLYKNENPDMVFLDLIMPNVDGKEALKQIVEYDASAKVVIVSSIGTKDVLMETIRLGAREFIQKPFSELQIMNALYKSLK